MRSLISGGGLWRASHIGGALLAATAFCTGAQAQDATWKSSPANGNFNNSGNWTPDQVPTGTATFNTSTITSLTFSAATTIGGWTFNPGASNYTFTLSLPGTLTFNGAGILINGGSATINNNGFLTFETASTAGSATINNNLVTAFLNNSTAGSAAITTNSGGSTNFFDNSDGGTARFITNTGGIFDISALTSAGMNAGSIEGAGNYYLGGKQLTVGGNNQNTTVSGVISDCGTSGTDCNAFSSAEPTTGGALVKVGSGTLTLTGINTYTGNTTVNDGMLEVDGSIATSHLTTVNNNTTLLGTGTVGNLQINNGGTFAPGAFATPGTFMTVQGNLTFQPGALYLVQVDPTSSTSATVTGSATLAGDVGATFASGHYITKQYDILHANSINGTFDALLTLNLPLGVLASLVYTPTDVFLDLTASLPLQGLNLNQINVANAIDNFFNNGGALPPGFLNLFNLTGANLGNALTALDGENATGAEHAAFQLMTEFLNLMLDANGDGRNGGGGGIGGPIGFAPDQEASFPPDIALAYDAVFKAPPPSHPSPASGGGLGWGFAQRWTAWAAGFGGSARTNGDPVIGSSNVTTNTFGYAAGLDYHYSPDTVFGFSLAGGGTSWNLVQGLGTGRSDAFLAGIYGVTHQRPAYIGGALAFANNWFTTNRTALGDPLSASFQGQSYAARLEGGYRFAVPAPPFPSPQAGEG